MGKVQTTNEIMLLLVRALLQGIICIMWIFMEKSQEICEGCLFIRK
jgi:hypothetical protein